MHTLSHLIPTTTSSSRQGKRLSKVSNFYKVTQQLRGRRSFQTWVCLIHKTHAAIILPHCFSLSLRAFVFTFRKCGVGERRNAHAPGSLRVSDPVCNVGSGANRRDDLERGSNEASTRYPGIYSNPPIITCPIILYASDKDEITTNYNWH